MLVSDLPAIVPSKLDEVVREIRVGTEVVGERVFERSAPWPSVFITMPEPVQ